MIPGDRRRVENTILNYRSIVDRLTGPLVPIIPAYASDGTLDLESTCGWINWLIERGIKLFWLTPGTTRYPDLTDDEVWDLTRACAEVTKDRALLISATNLTWSAEECIRYAEFSQECGADIVKVTHEWSKDTDAEAEFVRNKKVADVSPLPLFTYSLPGFSLDFFRRILDVPQFVGIKNDSGNYVPHTDLLRIIRQHGATFSSMSGGSMKPYVLTHPFGARAFADIRIAGVAPHLVIEFSRLIDERKYEEAVKIVQDYEEPLREKFEALSFTHPYRTCLHVAGHFKSDFDRNTKTSIREDEKLIVRTALEDLGLL